MSLPASGAINLDAISIEAGLGSGSVRSLSWVQSNTYYSFRDLGSLYGYRWYAAQYSQSLSRSTSSTVSNCTQNCSSQTNASGYVKNLANCYANNAVNCNAGANVEAPRLQADCNCNCNCYNCNCNYSQCNCNCCGCGTCFPAGSMVLMADLTWKEITQVVEGDMVWCPEGGSARVYLPYVTRLGDRPLATMLDRSVFWSGEHRFWVRRPSHESFWSLRPDLIQSEIDRGLLKPMNMERMHVGEFGRADQFGYYDPSSTDAWKENTPVMASSADGAGDPMFPLYLPFTDTLICINGYIVSGATDPAKFDYDNFHWEGPQA